MVLPVKIVTIENQVFQEEYGGKAFWLSWLRNEGYNVPDAILVSAMSHSTWYACIDDSSFLEALENILSLSVRMMNSM